MPKFKVKAMERIYVETIYIVEASDEEAAEKMCKAGEVPYTYRTNIDSDEEWIETLGIKQVW